MTYGTILALLVFLAVLGFGVWLLNHVDMPPAYRSALNGVAILVMVIAVLMWLASAFGLHAGTRIW